MGEEDIPLSDLDRWFCNKAAPQLHRNILEEMSVLAWVIQEAKAPPSEGAGTRVGLSESGLFALLKKLVKLKMDTLSLVASMQIQRVRNALGPARPEEGRRKSIPFCQQRP